METPTVTRPKRITAARKAVAAVEKLDAVISGLAPYDSEAHPDSLAGQAWAQLQGAMARVGLRADAVVEIETPLKMKTTWENGKKVVTWTKG